jgi:hypothetical protein
MSSASDIAALPFTPISSSEKHDATGITAQITISDRLENAVREADYI